MDFFNLNKKKNEKNTSIVLSVEGRMYPVDVFYLESKIKT